MKAGKSIVDKLDLKKLDTSHVIVQGTEYAIEDKETGCVYLTNKPYIDKLFKEMGYRNLGVIKILEEYAGKFVSDVGTLTDSCLFVDLTTDSFVVTSQRAIDWINDLIDRMDKGGFKVVDIKRSDTYYYWDQWLVKSPFGGYFAIYVDLCDEYVHVFSLDYEENTVQLNGLVDEGVFRFSEDDSILNLISLLETPAVISGFDYDRDLSVSEFVDLLITLGYVKKKRRNVYLTDEGEEAQKSQEILKNAETALDDYNSLSWILRHIRTVQGGFKFSDACELISLNFNKIRVWDVKKFYLDNLNETSDMFAFNKQV